MRQTACVSVNDMKEKAAIGDIVLCDYSECLLYESYRHRIAEKTVNADAGYWNITNVCILETRRWECAHGIYRIIQKIQAG